MKFSKKNTTDFEKELEYIEKQYPTCKFWVQYCRMIFIVKYFVYTQKSGDWKLHLETIERMIPFFHCTGHFNYAKSAQFYVEDMKALQSKMDDNDYKRYTEKGFWTASNSYVKFIQNHYGRNAIVVFDGYESITTKESERKRRANYIASADIYFN